MSASEIEKKLKALDASYRNKIVAIYLKEGAKSLKALHTSFSKKDFKNIASYAHKLKGSSKTIGFIGMSKICEKIESKARVSRDTQMASNVKQADAYMQLVKKISSTKFKI